MDITCISATQVAGFGVVKKFQTIDLPESEMDDHILYNFIRASDGKPLYQVVKKTVKPTPSAPSGDDRAQPDQNDKAALIRHTAALGKNKLEQIMTAEGVIFKPGLKATELAVIYLRHRGEDVD